MAFTQKYCTPTGAGAHDGSSEANAWTLAEAIAETPKAGYIINMKGTFSVAADQTLSVAGSVTAPIIWRGYSSTIGDGGRATINWTHTSSGTAAIIATGAYQYFDGLTISPTSTEACVRAFYANGDGTRVQRCNLITPDLANDTAAQISNGDLVNCYCEGKVYNGIYLAVLYCSILSASDGIVGGTERNVIVGNLIVRSGAAGDNGINLSSLAGARSGVCAQNTIYGFTDAIEITDSLDERGYVIANNLIYNCGAYGINYSGSASDRQPALLNNAIGLCTTARYNGIDTNLQAYDINVTADPFTAAGSDFSLNDNNPGGAQCRGAGVPTQMLWSGSQDNWLDIGALQAEPAAAGGGGGFLINGGLVS